MSSPTRSAAAELLGVPLEAVPGDAAAAFLASLPACGFVPVSDRCAAVNVLAGAAVPFDATEGDSRFDLSARVEDLAYQFWGLTHRERRAEWEALLASAGCVPATRLLALELGLDVPTRELYDPLMDELAVLMRELFVLAPQARSARRNTWLLANAASHADYCDAATGLRRLHPELAALDPVLMSRLKPDFAVAAFVEGAKAEPPLPVYPAAMEAAYTAYHARPSGVVLQATTEATPQQQAGWVTYVMCSILALAVLRGLFGIQSPQTPAIPRAQPVLNSRPGTGKPADSTPREVLTFEVDEEIQIGREPGSYRTWGNAGRPGGNPLRSLPVRVNFTQAEIDEYQRLLKADLPPRTLKHACWLKLQFPDVPGEYTLP